MPWDADHREAGLISVYSTCPSSHQIGGADFGRRIVEVAQWTEAVGWRGLLVYTDNTLVDPWATAQVMIQATERLVPLVAVQPVYMHPYSVARMIATIGFLHGRQVDLNLVTGGFAGHLRELGCVLGHDERYDRLVEYAKVIRKLLAGKRPVTHLGSHYGLNGATISPPLPPELAPRLLMSGASAASVAAQRALGIVRIAYPREVQAYHPSGAPLAGAGIRLGIIARDDADEAWRIARARFPDDPVAEGMHQIAAGQVESRWHIDLSRDALNSTGSAGVYWLHPFRVYKTFCPYLVGSYGQVADMLRRYFDLGIEVLILDVPAEPDDLEHAQIALSGAICAGAGT
jgi:alkanesulfonate monooxygenase